MLKGETSPHVIRKLITESICKWKLYFEETIETVSKNILKLSNLILNEKFGQFPHLKQQTQ